MAADRQAQRTERLLNLVIALLSTRTGLTKEDIRAAVPQYAGCGTDAAFDRMFERDKDDLRHLGVPIQSSPLSAWFEDEIGYRIDRDDYHVRDIHLSSAQLAVVGLAASVWRQAALSGPAARAQVKLRAVVSDTDPVELPLIEPTIRTTEAGFADLYGAVRDRCQVRFTYRKLGQEPQVRHLQPWGVASRRGHWYVVGHDIDRDARRVFRLSRIEGKVRRVGKPGSYAVPTDFDLSKFLAEHPAPTETDQTVVIKVRNGTCFSLRHQAQSEMAVDGEWDHLTLTTSNMTWLAASVAWHGTDAMAVSPPAFVDAVVSHLRGLCEAVLTQ